LFKIIEFVCSRKSEYNYSQDSVQFSVGIKVFRKTRLRRDVIYSYEDLLGRSVHPVAVRLYKSYTPSGLGHPRHNEAVGSQGTFLAVIN